MRRLWGVAGRLHSRGISILAEKITATQGSCLPWTGHLFSRCPKRGLSSRFGVFLKRGSSTLNYGFTSAISKPKGSSDTSLPFTVASGEAISGFSVAAAKPWPLRLNTAFCGAGDMFRATRTAFPL